MTSTSTAAQRVPTKPAAWDTDGNRAPLAPVRVAITYCAECGYEQFTLDLAAALMREFGAELSKIEIVPWHDGAFDVTVNGELVHSMYRDGGFPEHETIIAAVRERLAATD